MISYPISNNLIKCKIKWAVEVVEQVPPGNLVDVKAMAVAARVGATA